MADLASVRELIERTSELARCYAIWWELVNRENLDRYEAQIRNHEDYFAATAHSLFQSFVVISYQLFETRKDTKSIPALIESMKDSHPDLMRALTANIESNRPVLGKLFALRNKVYAHRSRIQSPEEIFAETGLTPDEMKGAVDFIRSVMSSLAEAAGEISSVEFEDEFELRTMCSREDTQLILQALEKHGL